jgi:hypothetical protein
MEGLSALCPLRASHHRIIASSHHHSVSLCVLRAACCVLRAACCVLCAVCCCVYGTYSTVRFGTRTQLLQRLCHHFTPRCAFVLIDRTIDQTIDQTGISIFSIFRLFVHRVNFHFFPTLLASLSFCFLGVVDLKGGWVGLFSYFRESSRK